MYQLIVPIPFSFPLLWLNDRIVNKSNTISATSRSETDYYFRDTRGSETDYYFRDTRESETDYYFRGTRDHLRFLFGFVLLNL